MKKLLILFICINISLMPLISISNISYADSGSDYPTIGGGSGGGWTNVDMTDPKSVVSAFKAYVASRNLKFVHVPNDVSNIVQFDYMMIKKASDALNIDLTTLNAYIWYGYEFATGGDAPVLKYFFHPSGLELLNQIYAKIIQDNNISANSSKSLYNGKLFKDDDGNSCYCFIKNTGIMTDTENMTNVQFNNQVTQQGTMLLTTGNKVFVDTINDQKLYFPFHVHGNTYTFCTKTFKDFNDNNNIVNIVNVFKNDTNDTTPNASPTRSIYLKDDYYNVQEGYFTVICINNGNTPFLGYFCRGNRKDNQAPFYCLVKSFDLSNPDLTNATVNADRGEENTPESNKSLTVITNSDTVNNYITNNTNNNTYNYNTDPNPPTNKPPKLPDTPDFPTGVTDPNGDPFNFTMPDIGIDWNLNLNVENLPFPFSIPFDFNNALKMLDVEPETPRFQGTIHVPYINYDWEIDLDFGKYDEYESLINMFQKVLLFGYVISLILATRAVMHIY